MRFLFCILCEVAFLSTGRSMDLLVQVKSERVVYSSKKYEVECRWPKKYVSLRNSL